MSGFTSMSLCRETCINAAWLCGYGAALSIPRTSARQSQRYSRRSAVYAILYPSDSRCIRVLNSAFVGCSRCALGFRFPEKYAHKNDPLNQGNLHELKLRLKIVRYPGIEVGGLLLQKFSPGGDGGSGRRPLPPDHLTFWQALH